MSDAVAHIRRPGSYSLKLPSMAISQLISNELLRASKHCGCTYKIYYYPLKSFLNCESPIPIVPQLMSNIGCGAVALWLDKRSIIILQPDGWENSRIYYAWEYYICIRSCYY